MTDYNFWDDRTHEGNEELYCPVIDNYCFNRHCDDCEAYQAMNDEYEKTDGLGFHVYFDENSGCFVSDGGLPF